MTLCLGEQSGRRCSCRQSPSARSANFTWEHCGIVRDRAGLESAIETLDRTEWAPSASPTLAAIELRNMHQVAGLIAAAALWREESRGAHYRTDFPGKAGRVSPTVTRFNRRRNPSDGHEVPDDGGRPARGNGTAGRQPVRRIVGRPRHSGRQPDDRLGRGSHAVFSRAGYRAGRARRCCRPCPSLPWRRSSPGTGRCPFFSPA